LRKVDLETGAVSKIIDVNLQIGHIQANPFVPGEIMYCHETGGDAPQRMWLVNADGTGNRPLYKETPDEWVTHEAWVDKDHVYFVIMGFLPRLRLHSTGIASINVRNDAMGILGQIDRGGFSHCNGSRDGRWAVGDSGPGDIHLIDLRSGEVILLSTGHVMRPDHAHPAFHPNGKEIIIQSGLITGGMKLDIMTIVIPEWMQNRR
jgi:oligogalacturonide lyase